MNLRRKLMQLLAAGPFLAQSTATAQSNSDAASDEPSARLRWGHINCKSSDDLGPLASKTKGDICSIASA